MRVVPNARRSALKGVHGSALKVAVAGVPRKGKANQELVVFLSRLLSVDKGAVVLLSGEKSRDKIIFVEGLSPEEIRSRLEREDRRSKETSSGSCEE